jgi:hypothetical protein
MEEENNIPKSHKKVNNHCVMKFYCTKHKYLSVSMESY